jgi:hypothetical protein
MIRDLYKTFRRKPTKLILKKRKLVNNKDRKVVPPNALLSGEKLLAKMYEERVLANCLASV